MNVFIVYGIGGDFDGENCEVEFYGCFLHREDASNLIDKLVEPSESFDREVRDIEDKNKKVMRDYLEKNRDAVDGFKHQGVKDDKERDNIINFLVANYSYSFNNFVGEDSFVAVYCDVSKLSKPYPKLRSWNLNSDVYYSREYFQVKELKVC